MIGLWEFASSVNSARVRHLFLDRPFFLVAAAFLADLEREAADRFLAALRACRDSAFLEAALRPSSFRALRAARERFADFLPLPALFPLRRSRAACFRTFFEAFPFFGTG